MSRIHRISLRLTAFILLGATALVPRTGAAQEGTPPNAEADAVLERLLGVWVMRGHVMGDSVTYRLHVQRTLMGRFVELHMHDVSVPSQYESRVFIGADTIAPQIIAHWMDSFGAAYSVPPGYGTARGDTLQFTIRYTTSVFHDVLSANADGTWRLLITSQSAEGVSVFADYVLERPLARPLAAPAMQAPVDSLAADVPPSLTNLPALRSRLQSAAATLVNQDETLIGTERAVRVRVIVAADGSMETAFIEQSSSNVAVDAAALRIVRTARFTPGRTAGVAVRSAVVLPLRFVFPDG